MITRDEVKKALEKYRGMTLDDETIPRITDEIVAIEKEWEELQIQPEEMGYSASVNCADICAIDRLIESGEVIKFFRKRGEKGSAGEVSRRYRRIALGLDG